MDYIHYTNMTTNKFHSENKYFQQKEKEKEKNTM